MSTWHRRTIGYVYCTVRGTVIYSAVKYKKYSYVNKASLDVQRRSVRRGGVHLQREKPRHRRFKRRELARMEPRAIGLAP